MLLQFIPYAAEYDLLSQQCEQTIVRGVLFMILPTKHSVLFCMRGVEFIFSNEKDSSIYS